MELTAQKKVTVVRWFITILLLIILGGIIVGYIYLGMKKARIDETAVITPEGTNLDENQTNRQEILDSLAKEISNITPEDKTAILDSLKNDPEETLTKEEKQSILDDLKKELISAE